MKAFCPDCNNKISVDEELYDDGDELSCPKCDIDLIVHRKGKKVKLKSAAPKFRQLDEELEDSGSFEENFEGGE